MQEYDNMDVATETWFKYLQETEKRTNKKKLLNEISRDEADKIYDWMAGQGGSINPEFDDLFGGAMRVAFLMASADTRKLGQVVAALKSEKWQPPKAEWGGSLRSSFNFKKVKQKERRRVGDLPPDFEPGDEDPRPVEEFTKDEDVADLNVERTYDFTIPAGPRKGETIQKSDKTTMSRAMAKLAKKGILDKDILDWWQKTQTFYTKDGNWRTIEDLFDDAADLNKHTVIVSRHPIDVLRMSDIGAITSCHREGGEYFQCAQLEAKGHGPIAYVVETKKLDAFLRGQSDIEKAKEMIVHNIFQRKEIFDTFHEHLNDAPKLELALRILKNDWTYVSEDVKNAITVDMVREAIRAKLSDEPWGPYQGDPNPPQPISDFDDEEIFRDRGRKIPGIVATTRVRLRKYEDEATGNVFTAPEGRTYGKGAPGFIDVVRGWTWDNQKDMFLDGDKLKLPPQHDLVRWGGSYEDTQDGRLLNHFFEADQYSGNVAQRGTEEEGEELHAQWEEQVQDLLQSAGNRAEHLQFYADVGGEWDEPYVSAGFSYELAIPLGWKGTAQLDDDGVYRWPKEERDYAGIPHAWRSDYTLRSPFKDAIEAAQDSGEFEWTVETHGMGTRWSHLEITISINCDDCNNPDDFDSFIDYYLYDIDGKYDEIYEKIRRSLVKENFIAPSDFDLLYDDIAEKEKELENFDVFGIDEDTEDGEVWFNFKQPPNLYEVSTGISAPGLGKPLPGRRTGFQLTWDKAFGTGTFGGSWDRSDLALHGAKHPPGEQLIKNFAERLRQLQEAANGYAEEQLEFDFGDKYTRPAFEGVSFGESTQIRLGIDKDNVVFFKLKLIIKSSDTKEEIEGAFMFMEYIDQYPGMIIEAMAGTVEEHIAQALEQQVELRKRMISGEKMTQLLYQLDSKYGAQADLGNEEAQAAMAIVIWIRDRWEKMRDVEKFVAIDQYMRPLRTPTVTPTEVWDKWQGMPRHWDDLVKARMEEEGMEAPTFHPSVLPTPANESIEEQIEMIDRMLNEVEPEVSRAGREPIDLRIYKVELGCVVDFRISGTDSQVENQIRGIDGVTTVRHFSELQRSLGTKIAYRVYEIKFEIYGAKARDTYRDSVLVPGITAGVIGITVRDRGQINAVESPLREYGLGARVAPPDRNVPRMVTPAIALDTVLADWAEGGVQIYDTPMNTNQMQYHVMVSVDELWKYCSRYYRGTKTDFDGRYKNFIRTGPRMPVYVALGQNGRVRLTGGEDLIWFARKSGLKELPVFFSYQRQV